MITEQNVCCQYQFSSIRWISRAADEYFESRHPELGSGSNKQEQQMLKQVQHDF